MNSFIRRWLPFLSVADNPKTLVCPVCGNEGALYGRKTYRHWALAGTGDGGEFLRRCRRCGAEVAIDYPWQWWRPRRVWVYSTTPEYGKGKRRRRERRARARGDTPR